MSEFEIQTEELNLGVKCWCALKYSDFRRLGCVNSLPNDFFNSLLSVWFRTSLLSTLLQKDFPAVLLFPSCYKTLEYFLILSDPTLCDVINDALWRLLQRWHGRLYGWLSVYLPLIRRNISKKKMQNNFHLIETQNALTNVPRIPKTKRHKVKIVNAWLILSCLQNSVKWNIALLEIIEKFWGPEWGFSWLDDPKYDTWDRADWYEDDLEAVKNQVYYWIQ